MNLAPMWLKVIEYSQTCSHDVRLYIALNLSYINSETAREKLTSTASLRQLNSAQNILYNSN